jgi:hypothetical protein
LRPLYASPLQLEASDALAKFYYPPVCAVTISYPESAVREERKVNGKLNGFGQLHPRSQGVVTLGKERSASKRRDGLVMSNHMEEARCVASRAAGMTSHFVPACVYHTLWKFVRRGREKPGTKLWVFCIHPVKSLGAFVKVASSSNFKFVVA